MGEKGEGSGGEGGGKWGRRGREVGGKGEGTGNGVPPCPPPQIWWAVARVVHSLLQLSAEIAIIIIYILLSFYIGCFLF